MSLDDFIDVRQCMATFSVEELCATDDEYFGRLENWDYLLAKALASEAPELLQCLASPGRSRDKNMLVRRP